MKPDPTISQCGFAMPRHWLQMKSFIVREEIRTGLTYGGIYDRIYRGLYPLKFMRLNKRVVFVKSGGVVKRQPDAARAGEIPLKAWVMNKAEEMRLSIGAVWMRLQRGTMERPATRTVHKRLVFVRAKE